MHIIVIDPGCSLFILAGCTPALSPEPVQRESSVP